MASVASGSNQAVVWVVVGVLLVVCGDCVVHGNRLFVSGIILWMANGSIFVPQRQRKKYQGRAGDDCNRDNSKVIMM